MLYPLHQIISSGSSYSDELFDLIKFYWTFCSRSDSDYNTYICTLLTTRKHEASTKKTLSNCEVKCASFDQRTIKRIPASIWFVVQFYICLNYGLHLSLYSASSLFLSLIVIFLSLLYHTSALVDIFITT